MRRLAIWLHWLVLRDETHSMQGQARPVYAGVERMNLVTRLVSASIDNKVDGVVEIIRVREGWRG